MASEANRFAKDIAPLFGAKLRNRFAGNTGPHFAAEEEPGAFLAQLWTLFGAPSEMIDTGFKYWIVDRETGLRFYAYLGAGGSAYGGLPVEAEALTGTLAAFDRVLNATPFADCAIEIRFDDGVMEMGAEDGVPFYRYSISDKAAKAAIGRAETVLARCDGDFWDYCNAALEVASMALDAARRRRLCEALGVLAIQTLDGLIKARLTPRRRHELQKVRDAGLEPLGEIAKAQALDALAAAVATARERVRARLAG